MSGLIEQIRLNRDRAAEIVKTVHAMKGNLSLCVSDLAEEVFVRTLVSGAILNAGPLQLWVNNYLEARTSEYMETLVTGVVANAVSLPSPPADWELAHDWCVPYARSYIMDCRFAIESVIELVDAPDEISPKGWEYMADQLKEQHYECIKEIASNLNDRFSNKTLEHAPGEVLLGISREAAAGIASIGSANPIATDPFEILHDDMRAKGATGKDIAAAFLDSRSPAEKNSLLQEQDGEREATLDSLVRRGENLRAKRKRDAKTSR